MSRSGYVDDCEQWDLIRYRGAVASAIRGARGQAFLKEMLAALDSLPEKKLIKGELQDGEAVCALGAVGRCRGLDMSEFDPDDPESIAGKFGIADALAKEIVFENDDDFGFREENQEARFARMRRWVESQIRPPKTAETTT